MYSIAKRQQDEDKAVQGGDPSTNALKKDWMSFMLHKDFGLSLLGCVSE